MSRTQKRRVKLPKTLPESYSSGTKEEALCHADVLMGAWRAHLPAVEWLLRQSKSSLLA